MGRKKIAIKRIMDERVRKVTFSKRKGGLVKKAMELSLLCDCEIGLVIFTPKPDQKLYMYATGKMAHVVNRYQHTSSAAETVHNGNYEALYEKKGAKPTDVEGSHDIGTMPAIPNALGRPFQGHPPVPMVPLGHLGLPLGLPSALPLGGALGRSGILEQGALGTSGMLNQGALCRSGLLGQGFPVGYPPSSAPPPVTSEGNKKALSVVIPGQESLQPPVLSGGPDSLLNSGEIFKGMGSPTDALPSPGNFFAGMKEKTPLGNTPTALASFSWSNTEAPADESAEVKGEGALDTDTKDAPVAEEVS